MINLEDIFSGWTNYVLGNRIASERAKPRLETCSTCAYMVKGAIFTAKCGKCGCPLIVKARARNNGCPLKKWSK